MIANAKYVHTNLIARDWRSLIGFYRDVLGCVPVPPERDYAGADLDAGTGLADARTRRPSASPGLRTRRADARSIPVLQAKKQRRTRSQSARLRSHRLSGCQCFGCPRRSPVWRRVGSAQDRQHHDRAQRDGRGATSAILKATSSNFSPGRSLPSRPNSGISVPDPLALAEWVVEDQPAHAANHRTHGSL